MLVEKGSAIVCWMATTSNLNLILLATEKNIWGRSLSAEKKYKERKWMTLQKDTKTRDAIWWN